MSKASRIEAQKAQALEIQTELLAGIKAQLDRIEKKVEEAKVGEQAKAEKAKKPSV